MQLRLVRLASSPAKLLGSYSLGFLGNGTLSYCIRKAAEVKGEPILVAWLDDIDLGFGSGWRSLERLGCEGGFTVSKRLC